jgi:protein-serine/threonine kinase
MVDTATSSLKELNVRDDSESIKIEDFTLLKVIGTGSYGKVILAQMKANNKIYAIKMLKKKHLIKKNQVEHTIAERSILENMKHPFIIELVYAFQTTTKLFFVLEFCPGGELFFHLSRIGNFDEKVTKFYCTQIILAIQHLHKHDIIYRDLKPENVLIDSKGYAKLTDFGLSKEGIKDNQSAHTFCGTPEYLAPEIVDGKGHGKAVDWWSVGAIMFEMLTGQPPFTLRDNNRKELFNDIKSCNLQMPEHISPACKDLLSKLFVADPNARIGCGPSGAQEIINHPWFAGVDWNLIYQKTIKPPFVPKI